MEEFSVEKVSTIWKVTFAHTGNWGKHETPCLLEKNVQFVTENVFKIGVGVFKNKNGC